MTCKAERLERRLGGLLEGEGGGEQGWLQSQNHVAGCGGHDGAPGGRLRAPCGRPASRRASVPYTSQRVGMGSNLLPLSDEPCDREDKEISKSSEDESSPQLQEDEERTVRQGG